MVAIGHTNQHPPRTAEHAPAAKPHRSTAVLSGPKTGSDRLRSKPVSTGQRPVQTGNNWVIYHLHVFYLCASLQKTTQPSNQRSARDSKTPQGPAPNHAPRDVASASGQESTAEEGAVEGKGCLGTPGGPQRLTGGTAEGKDRTHESCRRTWRCRRAWRPSATSPSVPQYALSGGKGAPAPPCQHATAVHASPARRHVGTLLRRAKAQPDATEHSTPENALSGGKGPPAPPPCIPHGAYTATVECAEIYAMEAVRMPQSPTRDKECASNREREAGLGGGKWGWIARGSGGGEGVAVNVQRSGGGGNGGGEAPEGMVEDCDEWAYLSSDDGGMTKDRAP
ncbi:hypothetical protein BJ912DRAFT_1106563 [Pholiota molesta]|nr:hypothetical protein BJ912DRAFT_1106563 [Pholiota molesta]